MTAQGGREHLMANVFAAPASGQTPAAVVETHWAALLLEPELSAVAVLVHD